MQNRQGSSQTHLYTDDTILNTSGPLLDAVVLNLQESFNAIQPSFQNLQILLNSGKTKLMLFKRLLQTPAHPISISMLDGLELFVAVYKYLGVWLDSSLPSSNT